MPSVATVVQDIIEIGDHWTQGNADLFAFSKVPTGTMKDKRAGVREIIYRLASFANFMSNGGKKKLHENGDTLPVIRAALEVLITVEAEGGITEGSRIDVTADADSRWLDLERNIVPGLLGMGYQQLETSLADNMTNANIWGTGKTLTGTGALNVATDANFDQQLTGYVEDLLKYVRPGFDVEMFVDRTIFNIMRRNGDYTGAGVGSNAAKALPEAEFLARLFDGTKIKAVHMFGDGVRNTARSGQTVALEETGRGVCWVGVVDRRGDWNLATPKAAKPDGAIQLALPRPPEIVVESPQSQIEDLYCQYTAKFFNPRAELGFFIPESEFRA